MTPQEEEAQARSRYAIISVLRGTGVIVMLFGLAVWFSVLFAGNERLGQIIFALGLIESLVIPPILARQWRTPRP